MTAQSYGFRTPTGTDLVTEGDDDITFNAERVAQLLEQLRFYRGPMPSGTNTDLLTKAGSWDIPNATIAQSLTGTALPVIFPGMFVNLPGTTIVKAQLFLPYGTQAGMWWRVGRGEGTWEPWVNPNNDTSGFFRGFLPSGTNIDTEDLNGAYGIPNQTAADSMGGTWPTRFPGIFISVAATVFVRAQIFIPYSAQAAFWWRAGLGTGTYTPWKRAVGEDEAGGDSAGLANSVLQDEFYSHFGGPVMTGGKAAVAIRFDHGLNKFNSTIRPMLESRNLKYCLALASQRWTQAENDQVTATMVNSWAQGGLCEIWNHGRTAHNNASGYDANYTYWVTGLEELRAQLPAAFISGVILPGTGTSGQFDGLGGAGNAKQIYDSIGGQVILAHHAVVSGAFSGTEMRPLDGKLRQGQYHFGMESRTAAQIIAKIQEAQDQKKGLQLMMHPSLIGEPGYITAADFEQVMSYIATERNAGRLAALSPYELLIADATPQIVVEETAGRTVKVWDYLNDREQLIYGDTGRRLVDPVEGVGGSIHIVRSGRSVDIYLYDIVAGSGTQDILEVPAGFRSPHRFGPYERGIVFTSPLSGAPEIRRASVFGNTLRIYSAVDGVPYSGHVRYLTEEVWPTTLPGVAS